MDQKLVQRQKREIKLSTKALVHKIEKLQKEHQTKVHKITGAIKELMQNDDNGPQVRPQLDNLIQMVGESTLVHESVVPLLSKEEQEKQNEWFASVLKCNNGFIEDAKQWFSETGRQIRNTNTHASTNEICDVHHDEQESQVPKDPGKNDETSVIQDDVEPTDSLSGSVSGRGSGKRSPAGVRSNVSTTSSARFKAEAWLLPSPVKGY